MCLLILFKLLIFTFLGGSNKNDPPKKVDIIKYYKFINDAKYLVYNNDFKCALHSYNNAFLIIKKPFHIDVKNALALACYLKDTINYYKVAEFILKKDIKCDDKNFFCTDLDIRLKEEGKFDNNLRNKKLLKLFNDDQAVRPKKPFLSDSDIKLRDSMDHINYKVFCKLIKEYGFPNEESFGYFVGDYTIYEVLNTLCIHFILVGYNKEILELLGVAFIEGKIPNVFFANLIDRNSDAYLEGVNSVENRYLVRIGAIDYYPIFNKSKNSISKINNKRLSIGLDSLHISQKYFLSYHYCKSRFIKNYNPEPLSVIEILPQEIFGDYKSNPDLIRINKEKYICN